MSAEPRIIEGTWEEVARHAREFAGHRLRVIVLEDGPVLSHPGFDTAPSAVKAWIERLNKWATSLPPVKAPVDDSRETIYADRLDAQR